MNSKPLLWMVARPTEKSNTVRLFSQVRCIVPLIIAAAFSVGSAQASLVLTGALSGSGAGIGGTNIILNVHANGTEDGCVAWNGTTSVIGPAACPVGSGIPGGDEATGTQTRTILETGIRQAEYLFLVMNPAESGGGSIQLDQMILTIYNANGTLSGFSTSLAAPVFINPSDPGGGSLGFGFKLDAADVATLNASGLLNCDACRFGLASSLSLTSGGQEVFSIVQIVPEPFTILTVAGGLAGLGLLRRYRRTKAKG